MSEDEDLAALRFLNSMFCPAEPCEPWPPLGVAGTLTAELLASALDELLASALEGAQQPVLPDPPASYEDLFDVVRFPVCGAVGLAPDESLKNAVKWELITRGIAVDPVAAAYLNSPVQGPAPLRCELGEHPEETWHREGRTWWK